MKNEYLIKYISHIPFEHHIAANSLEDAIRFIKRFDEDGKIVDDCYNGIDKLVGESVKGVIKNEIVSIKKINKEKIELGGIS